MSGLMLVDYCRSCGIELVNVPTAEDMSTHNFLGFCTIACSNAYDQEKRAESQRQWAEVYEKSRKERLWKDFYKTPEWRTLRYRVLRKYGFKCGACGRTKEHGVVLHVDHIKPRSNFPELQLEESNLQILCEDCNLGKSNTYSDDLRERRWPALHQAAVDVINNGEKHSEGALEFLNSLGRRK